jgi:hypothetical protein
LSGRLAGGTDDPYEFITPSPAVLSCGGQTDRKTKTFIIKAFLPAMSEREREAALARLADRRQVAEARLLTKGCESTGCVPFARER